MGLGRQLCVLIQMRSDCYWSSRHYTFESWFIDLLPDRTEHAELSLAVSIAQYSLQKGNR